MKKIMLLVFFILGVSTWANAVWVRWQPSTWTSGTSGVGNPTATVTCYNLRAPRCMEYSGPGNSPQNGQKVKLYNDQYEMVGSGTVINCIEDPGEYDGSTPEELNGIPTTVEVELENSNAN